MSKLFLVCAANDELVLDGGRITVTFEAKTGRKTRIKIEADRSIPIRLMKDGRRIRGDPNPTSI